MDGGKDMDIDSVSKKRKYTSESGDSSRPSKIVVEENKSNTSNVLEESGLGNRNRIIPEESGSENPPTVMPEDSISNNPPRVIAEDSVSNNINTQNADSILMPAPEVLPVRQLTYEQAKMQYEQRVKALEDLRDNNLITEDEFKKACGQSSSSVDSIYVKARTKK